MRVLRCVALLLLCLPAFAAHPGDAPVLQDIVGYGQAHLDLASGLVANAAGAPQVSETSVGVVAACFATGQNLDQARLLLGKILDQQAQSGPQQGCFPSVLTAVADPAQPQAPPRLEAAPTPEATLYAIPLLAYVLRAHAEPVGPELAARLRLSLAAAEKAVGRMPLKPLDDGRFLLRAAAHATVAAALGADASVAEGEVEDWLRLVTRTGLPAGHSPMWDALKYVSLKWIRECLPETRRVAVDRALTLTAIDMAGRIHPAATYLAGAINEATVGDYASASGFASYVLATDFGQTLPGSVEPYMAMALLPEWRAPQSVTGLTVSTGLRRTRSTVAPVRATDTYVGTGYSLGTMSGEVGPAGVPIYCTLARSARPTLYFYCDPSPCNVQSVQVDNLAVCSFNFDNIAIAKRVQASLRGVLGARDAVKSVYCYGVPWTGQPTAVGELETVAVETADCYIGITLTRTGPSGSNQGAAAKAAVLEWSGPEQAQNLLLTIYARPQDYILPRAMHNLRAGVVLEVVSHSAYPTIADFVKHLGAGRIKQAVKSGKERITEPEKPKDPNVIIPEPKARGDRSFRIMAEQTIEYALEGRTLKLVEDLLANECLERQIDGVTEDAKYLWDSDLFKWEPAADLTAALEPFTK